MRVAYLTGRYPAISHTFILWEVLALRARGVDVVTFSVWRSPPEELLAEADEQEARRTYSLLPPRWSDWLQAHLRAIRRGLRAYLATLREAVRLGQHAPRGVLIGALWFAEAIVLWDRCRHGRLDHVHAHLNGTAPSVALVATSFGRRSGTGPLTWSFTVHGPTEFYDVARERLPDKVRSAALVVCISDFARAQLMGMVDESHWTKLVVVHCGVDSNEFRPRQRPAKPSDYLEVLSVGRLVQTKGQAVLLEAVRELVRRGIPVRATIVGGGPKRLQLEQVARDLGVSASVTFCGAVGQDEISRYYDRADIFCLSSFAEGIPVVLMEAMAKEVPVVAPMVMGVAELVEDGVSGRLVQPGRPDLLADAIQALAEDVDARVALGKAGRRKVTEDFSVEESARILERLFGDIKSSRYERPLTSARVSGRDGPTASSHISAGPGAT